MKAIEPRSFRSDIQGLRAIAVLLVVIFHIWPEWLPGGYVGVDVFFVISGFLITSHLYREIENTGQISLGRFYARRVRRLLPAASVVLLFTAIATILLAPRFKWLEITQDIAASTLYVQNWRLLFNAIDYLGAEEVAGPLQHFWSLAIEEQYYIFWPMILIGLAAISARRSARGLMALVTLIVIAVSLFLSIRITESDQPIAYFATHTRVWELAIGSLLAFVKWEHSHRMARAGGGLLGFCLILASAFLFTTDTAFPGYSALLPTLGAALVLWAGSGMENNLPHERLFSPRPIQFLGDISYSLYLWHWPLIVFMGYMIPDQSNLAGGGILVLSIATAWLSKRYVEDRYRQSLPASNNAAPALFRWSPRANALALATVGMSTSLAASAAIALWVNSQKQTAEHHINAAYPGAASIFAGIEAPSGLPPLPAPENARRDRPDTYSKPNRCHLSVRGGSEPRLCDVGVSDGGPLIVLIGDSHAAHWVPAFGVAAQDRGWRVYSYTKAACALTLLDPARKGRRNRECTAWSKAVLKELATLQPALVILGRSRGARLYDVKSREESDQKAVPMLAEILHRIQSSTGAEVAVIRDTPKLPFDPLMCFEDSSKCQTLDIDDRYDTLVAAASIDGFAKVIDMTDAVCPNSQCDAVIGNVIVWRDRHHLTATYAETLAPLLAERIDEVIPLSASRENHAKRF